MTCLLDACTFLWFALDSPRLSRPAKSIIEDENNSIYLSVVSSWELTVKYSLGRLALPIPAGEFVPKYREAYGMLSLPLEEGPALLAEKLPAYHSDPFGRMLICQAIWHELTILTPDPAIHRYAVRCLW